MLCDSLFFQIGKGISHFWHRIILGTIDPKCNRAMNHPSMLQRLKKSPKLFMEAYHKSMAGLERRRSIINLQFMLEMRKLEEDDESRFEEEYNVWLSDEPLTNHEICKLMRGVERERKLEGKPPLVQFLPRSKRPKKTPNKTERVHSSRKLNGPTPSAPGVESTVPGDAHA